MLGKFKIVFGKDFNKIKKTAKRIIFKNIVLKITSKIQFIINLLNWLFRIKFKVNLKDKFVFDEYNHQVFYSYLHRNMFFVDGIQNRLFDLQNQYLTNHIEFNNESLVIDCGANIGEFSLAILNYNSEIKLFCFEPEEREFNVLKKNLEAYNVTLVNTALSNQDGQIELFSKNESGDSSIFKTENSTMKHISCTKLSTFFTQNKLTKCTLLKLEAEGAEPEILEGAREVLDKIQYISVDCGPERGLNQEKTIQSVHTLLKQQFDLIDFSKERDVLLFKNSTFS